MAVPCLAAAAHRDQLDALRHGLVDPCRARLVRGEAVSGLGVHLDDEVGEVRRLDQNLVQGHADVLAQVRQKLVCREAVHTRAPTPTHSVSLASTSFKLR